MKYNPHVHPPAPPSQDGRHHRRSIRLKGYDYSQTGGYFITICTDEKKCLFGEIVDGEMKLNPFGRIVEEEWKRTTAIRPSIELDEYVVMPNHFHGIVIIDGDCRGELQFAPTTTFKSPSNTIGAIIRGFKLAVTKRINEMRKSPGVRVWQRNYYEHIIRGQKDLNAIRRYIYNNPINWLADKENQHRP